MWTALFTAGLVTIWASSSFAQVTGTDSVPLTARPWKQMGALQEPRELPRLIRIDNDRAIIVGGGSELRESASKTTEVYSIARGSWTYGPELIQPRRDAEAIRLDDGAIMVIGGSAGPSRTGSKDVELLGVDTGMSKRLADMGEARIGHTATLLRDGKILVVGGQSDPTHYLATAEIYDPKADRWASAGRLQEARAMHHARLLKDGTVLVIGGGTDISATHSAEIYDPARNQWSPAGSMREPRWGFASAVLDDGRILIAGGRVPAKKGATVADDVMVILRGTEIYDPTSRSWSDGPAMNVPRTMGIANVELVRVESGQFLFAGGRTYPAPYHGTPSVEAYDPTTNQWTLLRSMNIGRSYQAVVGLARGDVLIAGGRGVQFLPLNATECLSR